ncbi:MAG: dephospho-CoA kinase [Candidatus Eremiobacteraeota bacterium]|nr:dephospho-CoA kinase [Candidatus Eremiobacteraeota bacterium]MBV8365000.1 dephospho-CoA kinase [Candidatus Eremiobacteraeota bacterium]
MIVGLTGGIGSGKSTVAQLLAAQGAVIVDTDAVAREVVEPPSAVLDAIRYEFGDTVIGADGKLDRKAVAAIVFADPRKRELLEGLTHPAIRARTLELINAATPGKVIVAIVPLLFESGFDRLCDTTVAVVAGEEQRLARAAERDQAPREAVAARMHAQLSDDEFERLAAYIVRNDGDRAHLERQVDALWQKLSASSQ